MKKITLATFKSFVRKNEKDLFIKELSSFDGMVDCVMPTKNSAFSRIKGTFDKNLQTLGIVGVWIVRSSRDCFRPYEDEIFEWI